MAKHTYRFRTRWRVPGSVEEVTDVFRSGADLARWWPAVYLDSQERDPGDANGLGYVTDLHSKGWLPYTVRWRSRAVEVRHPYGFTIEATGDFVGRGDWIFTQEDAWVIMTYDWQISVNKPLLRRWAGLLRPLYAFNHRWAMKKGEESLKLELARRRASTPEERARVPAAPAPTTISPVPMLIGALLVLGIAAGIAYIGLHARRILRQL